METESKLSPWPSSRPSRAGECGLDLTRAWHSRVFTPLRTIIDILVWVLRDQRWKSNSSGDYSGVYVVFRAWGLGFEGPGV